MPSAHSDPAARVRSASCRKAADASSLAPLRVPASTSSARDHPKKPRSSYSQARRAPTRAAWSRFDDAEFYGGTVRFAAARFSGSDVSFRGARFYGEVGFRGARFSGGRVDFSFTRFSGGTVRFSRAEFSGGEVDFTDPRDWSVPPAFSWTGAPPQGVILPGEDRSQP
jgi:hypothetical protein